MTDENVVFGLHNEGTIECGKVAKEAERLTPFDAAAST
jgi:hypothetical protein